MFDLESIVNRQIFGEVPTKSDNESVITVEWFSYN